MALPHGRIGDPSPAEVYELVLSDFVAELVPPPGFTLPSIKPADYFITSGDAIQKTNQYSKEVAGLTNIVQQMIGEHPNPEMVAFHDRCLATLQGCQRLKAALEAARGDAVFMETEWSSESTISCIPKNPRIKK